MNLFFHTALIFVSQWSSFFFGIEESKYDFHPPVKIEMILAANFGELRRNHFHMGIDIKTDGHINLPLYSIDNGYVSRIKISPFGYGKVIYVNHPGGITSVYAHCNDFPKKIMDHIDRVQKELQENEVDIYFSPSEIPIKKGEQIAFSGNTGHSFGPHLHFELRDTDTEEALNPLKYGFKIFDNVAPTMRRVKFYELDKKGNIITILKELSLRKKTDKLYEIDGVIRLNNRFSNTFMGIAIDGFDSYNGSSNKLGIYSWAMTEGSDTLFSSSLNRIPFEKSRYINAYTDCQVQSYRDYHKLFYSEYNMLPIYSSNKSGRLNISSDKERLLTIVGKDVAGNQVRIKLTVKATNSNSSFNGEFWTNYLSPDTSYQFSGPTGTLTLPKQFSYQYIPNGFTADTQNLSFLNANWPVQEPLKISLFPLPILPIEKQFIVQRTGKHSKALIVERMEKQILANAKEFGLFEVLIDTMAPTIRLLSRRTTLNNPNSNIYWTVDDSGSGVARYDVYVNGQWESVYMSAGGRTFSLRGSKLHVGENKVEIVVTDYCSNIKKAEWNIRLL
jgi:hypothetical protein